MGDGATTRKRANTGSFATVGASTGAKWDTSVSNSVPFWSNNRAHGPPLPTTLPQRKTTKYTATREGTTAPPASKFSLVTVVEAGVRLFSSYYLIARELYIELLTSSINE